MTEAGASAANEREGLAYEAARIEAEKTLEAALRRAPPPVRECTAHLAGARGKGIRTAALLACAMGESTVPHAAVKLAAAVELLHLATLVHDDVIDDADTRRGIPTLQKLYGRRAAVICGDYLLCAAMKTAADIPERQKYSQEAMPDYMSRICLGEMTQLIHNGDLDLSVFRYLKIIRGKTAALFEASYLAGAMLCTEDAAERARYAKLGRAVGMIFQITDDCNDFELQAQDAKKPVRSDYEQGVVTLPLIHALETRPEFKERARSERLSRKSVDGAVREAGGLAYARLVAGHYKNRAEQALDKLSLTQEKRKMLSEILEKAYRWPTDGTV